MSVQIIDIECPECRATNWFNNGDVSDFTAPDVEAIRCWSCLHEFFTMEDNEEIEILYGQGVAPSEVIIEDGHRTASEAAKC